MQESLLDVQADVSWEPQPEEMHHQQLPCTLKRGQVLQAEANHHQMELGIAIHKETANTGVTIQAFLML